MSKIRIRPEVAAKLGYYVYAYVDPRNFEIFYVGKGCRGRALAHLDDAHESEKNQRISDLKHAGLNPQIEILAHGMADEETALRVEAAVIDVLRPGKKLTNRVRGFRALQFGRVFLSELEFLYAAKPVRIADPCLAIRINRLYRPGMSATEIYEVTRGVWKLGARRQSARYALAVYQGVIRQVYEIHEWHKAGTTRYATRTSASVKEPGRWEFTGSVAVRLGSKYCGGSVVRYLRANSQNPITYINC